MRDKGHLAHNDPAAEVLTGPNAPLRHKKKGMKGKIKGFAGSHQEVIVSFRTSFKGGFLY